MHNVYMFREWMFFKSQHAVQMYGDFSQHAIHMLMYGEKSVQQIIYRWHQNTVYVGTCIHVYTYIVNVDVCCMYVYVYIVCICFSFFMFFTCFWFVDIIFIYFFNFRLKSKVLQCLTLNFKFIFSTFSVFKKRLKIVFWENCSGLGEMLQDIRLPRPYYCLEIFFKIPTVIVLRGFGDLSFVMCNV